MPVSSLTMDERRRRVALVNSFLRDGYGPLRVLVGKGSATEQADKSDGKASGTYARWIRDEERRRREGRDWVLPNWDLYIHDGDDRLVTMPPSTSNVEWVKPIPEVRIEEEVPEDFDARARLLRGEIVTLVTSSDRPLTNPECIVVDTTMTRRFNRSLGDYEDVAGVPRTLLSATPTVEPVADCRNRKFIFTAAQNDAELNEPFWRSLKLYAEFIGAEIVVGPLTYETQWWAENSALARSYAPALVPHLCFGQLAIGERFVFCGEMNTLVTASAPISDLVTYSRNRWAVFPAAKRQLKSVASTDPGVQAHQVMTTGMVTRPKIVPRKAGIKSLFHQVQGAVVVEFDEDGRIFCRQITAAEDGSFYDLDLHVGPGMMSNNHRPRAVVCGDIHLRKLDALNSLGTFGFAPHMAARNHGSLIDRLRPEHIVLHDVFDNETRNHHSEKDPGHAFEMAVRRRDSVLSEIGDVAEFLFKVDERPGQVIVVESNHDLGLTRWVQEGRYRGDGGNMRVGLALDAELLDHRARVGEAIDSGLPPPRMSLLRRAIELTMPKAIETVEWAFDGHSRLIDGIEVGHHGFRGANGSKGTVRGFARMGRKLTIGDKHSPEIDEGVYVAGCMELNQGYNKGPSSWAIAHVVQYPDGNRTIITMQDGRWKAERPRITV